MGDHYYPTRTPVAKKMYRCSWCAYPILEGEKHHYSFGYYDGAAQANRFHDECWEDTLEEGGEEFMPGSGEPPERMVNWQRLQDERKQ